MFEYDDCHEFVEVADLTQRISLDDYFAEDHKRALKGRITIEEILRRRAILEKIAESGGEWWRWISGTEPQMQSGGIALVRDGKVLWAYQSWIS